jgi:hydroxyacylglutathione hydrolase
MLFRQVVDDDLGCASYLVGDEDAGQAVVVDPAFHIEPYVEQAERDGVRIVAVLETHNHADHLSGHGRFALEHRLPVHVHQLAAPVYPFEPLEDGTEVRVGEVALRTIHTPGHRPEHCAFAVIDRSRADEPWLVLTGDSLFVGDAARPDLAVAALDGARGLYGSLRRLVDLGDGVEVFPGHVAGSLCGAGMSSKASTTIGFERRFNPALRLVERGEEEFVADASGGSQPRPPNMERIVELNRGPFVPAAQPLRELEDAGGTTVLDVRPTATFVCGHLPGAINVPVSGTSFATKAGFVLLPDERVAVHGSTREEAERAARGLHAIGFLDLAGAIVGDRGGDTTEPVSVADLRRLVADGTVEVLDVREREERDDGYIPGSRHFPYRLARACAGDLGNGHTFVTVCESGARAAVAASVLAHEGVDARPVLDGGVPDWERDGEGTVSFRRCGSA